MRKTAQKTSAPGAACAAEVAADGHGRVVAVAGLGLFPERPPRELERGRELGRARRAHAGDGGDVGHRRGEQPRDAPEPDEQLVGDVDGRPARHPRAQHEGDEFGIGQGGRAVEGEAWRGCPAQAKGMWQGADFSSK